MDVLVSAGCVGLLPIWVETYRIKGWMGGWMDIVWMDGDFQDDNCLYIDAYCPDGNLYADA